SDPAIRTRHVGTQGGRRAPPERRGLARPRLTRRTTMDRTAGSGAPAHRVVIVGGGFGGLFAARALRRGDVAITLVDRAQHHLFQPLLYQVATGILSEGQI